MNNNHFFNPIDDYEYFLENDYLIAFLPLLGLSSKDKIKMNEYTIYPRFRIDTEIFDCESLFDTEELKSLSSEEKADKIKEKEKNTIDLICSHALLAFPFRINDKDYIDCDYQYEMSLLESLVEHSEFIVNLIMYYNCNYFKKFQCLPSPGYCNQNFTTSLILLNLEGEIKIHAGQILNLVPSIESFVMIENKLTNHPLTREDIGETGEIVKDALSMNSMIINTNSMNSKFVLTMQLIDFLMLPYEYGNFKKIKGNFICHIAKNKSDYHFLSKRFKKLTEPTGLRTNILHGGQNINLLLSYKELEELFEELFSYIQLNIESMINNYNRTLSDFKEYRENLKNQFK